MLSAIISAAVLGSMMMVISFGTNFTLEQTRATGLTTAGKMWSLDANDASAVSMIDSSDVVFYDAVGRHPGVYISRVNGTNQIDLTCRKSEWRLTAGTLTDTVSTFSAANPTCDYGDPSIQPTATSQVISVDGFNSSAKFTAANAGGRDLHYVNGTEVGLSASSFGTPNQSIATRASWWRNYEWAYSQPRVIDVTGDVTFPLSGVKPTSILGTTWLSPTPQGATVSTAESTPTKVTYSPGVVTFNVARSSTVGAVYGGYHEGVTVDITTPANCGPYSVQYDLLWTPTTAAAPSRSTTLTTFTSPAPIDVDQIPNGSAGTMKVTASCPSAVQSGADAVYSVAYTQPLPQPTLTVGTPDPTQPNVHKLAWAPVSSLSSVVYRTQVQKGTGNAWVDQQQATPNPDPTPGKTIAWPLGSTYGVSMNYRVIPELGSTVGNASNEAGIYTQWPPVTGVAWDPYDSTGLNLTTTVSSYTTCPAGTSPQYQQRLNPDLTGWQGWSGWSPSRAASTVLQQGQLAQRLGEVRCAYDAAQYTPTPGEAPQLSWVQPITSIPAPPTMVASNPSSSGPTATVSWATSGCPVNTTPEFRWQDRVDNNLVNGIWTGFTGWSATMSTSVAMNEGAKLEFQVVARCVSSYTWDVPPAGEEPQIPTNGPPGATATMSPWVRPIATPAATTNIWNDTGGTSQPKNDRFLWNPVGCPSGTWVQYRRGINGALYGGLTSATSQDVATSWGTKYTPQVGAECSSAYADSAFADVAGPYWVTNVPQATGVGNSVSPGTVYTGGTVWVSVSGGNCPAGTSTHYYTTDGVGDTYYGSFSGSWGSTGTKTYTTRAYCQGPDARGDDSAPSTATLRVIPPPAPAAPAWVNLCVSTPNDGFQTMHFDGSWASSSWATSYSSTFYIELGGVWTAGKTQTWSGTSGPDAGSYYMSGGGASYFELRVTAINASGSSIYSASADLNASQATSGAYGC
ncbi:MAG: hypothetical protein JWM49_2032 [Microbacteriaceae bacterium]|nr:hypothetical protein [Microbacteriaceae bacterium]